MRGATDEDDAKCRHNRKFQSTHPLRGATTGSFFFANTLLFQSTHPLRGATSSQRSRRRASVFQSTHPLRGATANFYAVDEDKLISIHAPIGGCDCSSESPDFSISISIHAPLAGCDSFAIIGMIARLIFQSTHPLRGATFSGESYVGSELFQSTHPLRGATLKLEVLCYAKHISIHAPLAGCDFARLDSDPGESISIHAPLAGCDGVRVTSLFTGILFQSTHPLRGATAKLPKYSRQICAKATKFLQSQTKSGVAACWAKGKRLLFPTLRGANLPGKTGTLPVRIRQSARPLARNRPWHRSAQRAFHTCFQGNKSAGCLSLCP